MKNVITDFQWTIFDFVANKQKFKFMISVDRWPIHILSHLCVHVSMCVRVFVRAKIMSSAQSNRTNKKHTKFAHTHSINADILYWLFHHIQLKDIEQ